MDALTISPGSAAHQLVCAPHPCAMTIENVFVLPAADGPPRCLRAQATLPQSAPSADRRAARIADLGTATRVLKASPHRMQQLAGWATVRIGCSVVAEVLQARSDPSSRVACPPAPAHRL